MPLPEELRASLDSQVADIANIGERHGGMMTAAVFLREFVGKDAEGKQIPWAHVDIAGPSFNNGSPYATRPSKAPAALSGRFSLTSKTCWRRPKQVPSGAGS
ncbi:probable cytosol aminopeptidase [Arthrobacter sp. Hiyo1]|nr:probable cytosol aminopeptidase [Arthrobacter sp. Hiyo1]